MTAIFVDQAIDQLKANFRGAIIEPRTPATTRPAPSGTA